MEPFSSNIKKLLENEKKTLYISGSNFPSSKKKMKENPALKKCLIFRE